MKLGPVTKSDKRNTTTSKKKKKKKKIKIVMSLSFFPIYGQFAVIRKPVSGRMIYKTYIFINNPYKN